MNIKQTSDLWFQQKKSQNLIRSSSNTLKCFYRLNAENNFIWIWKWLSIQSACRKVDGQAVALQFSSVQRQKRNNHQTKRILVGLDSFKLPCKMCVEWLFAAGQILGHASTEQTQINSIILIKCSRKINWLNEMAADSSSNCYYHNFHNGIKYSVCCCCCISNRQMFTARLLFATLQFLSFSLMNEVHALIYI